MTAAALRMETSRRREAPRPADQLRTLAARVRKLSIVGRLDVERSFIERDDVARELVRLAQVLDRA